MPSFPLPAPAPPPAPRLPLQSAGDDLASVVSAIKAQYGLRYVYAWHALGGFWGGLGLRDPEMAKYQVGRPAGHAGHAVHAAVPSVLAVPADVPACSMPAAVCVMLLPRLPALPCLPRPACSPSWCCPPPPPACWRWTRRWRGCSRCSGGPRMELPAASAVVAVCGSGQIGRRPHPTPPRAQGTGRSTCCAAPTHTSLLMPSMCRPAAIHPSCFVFMCVCVQRRGAVPRPGSAARGHARLPGCLRRGWCQGGCGVWVGWGGVGWGA